MVLDHSLMPILCYPTSHFSCCLLTPKMCKSKTERHSPEGGEVSRKSLHSRGRGDLPTCHITKMLPCRSPHEPSPGSLPRYQPGLIPGVVPETSGAAEAPALIPAPVPARASTLSISSWLSLDEFSMASVRVSTCSAKLQQR